MREDGGVAFDVTGNDRETRGHRLQQHDALALEARSRRAEDICGLVVARQFLIGYEPAELHIGQAPRLYKPLVSSELPGTDDDQSRVRQPGFDLRVGFEQIVETLSLLRASDKEDVELAVLEALDRLGFGREPLDVDSVGDDVVVAREVLLDEARGGGRNRDLAVQTAEPASQMALAPRIEELRLLPRRMKRPDIHGLRVTDEVNRQHGHERLVDVHDVERLLGKEAAHGRPERERQRDARERAARRQRNRTLADCDDVRVVNLARRGRDNADVMAAFDELVAEMAAVAVDAPGNGPVVGRDQCDLHERTRRKKLEMVGNQPICRGVARMPRHCWRITGPRPSWRTDGCSPVSARVSRRSIEFRKSAADAPGKSVRDVPIASRKCASLPPTSANW